MSSPEDAAIANARAVLDRHKPCARCKTPVEFGEARFVEGKRICEACVPHYVRRITRASKMFIWLTVLSAGVCAWGLYATARRGEDLWPTTVGVTALVAISPLLVMLVGWAAMRSLNSGMAKAEALNASVELSLALPRPERTEQDGN